MELNENPGALKRFRRTVWKFQQTFETQLRNLPEFVSTILAACESLRSARVTLELVVFEPTTLIALLERYSLSPQYEPGVSVTAAGKEEIEALLCPVLADWIDFIFVPDPNSFSIYADHDEFATFYAHKRSNLNRITESLIGNSFRPVADYKREL